MKRLSRDISRCLGKGEEAQCPDRQQCARYRTMKLDNAAGPNAWHPIAYVADLRDPDGVCRRRIEVTA